MLGILGRLQTTKLSNVSDDGNNPVTDHTHLHIPQVQAVDGVLSVPLEPHDQAHRLGGGRGGVTGQGDAATHVAKHLDAI